VGLDNHYDVLRVKRFSNDLDKIKKNYRSQMVKYHPDRKDKMAALQLIYPKKTPAEIIEFATEVSKKVTLAWAVLSDEGKKVAYDRQLRAEMDAAARKDAPYSPAGRAQNYHTQGQDDIFHPTKAGAGFNKASSPKHESKTYYLYELLVTGGMGVKSKLLIQNNIYGSGHFTAEGELTIQGNASGNVTIRALDDVTIHRNVTDNVRIFANGNIRIEGYVCDKAEIYAKGDIIIHGSVAGNAIINADGDVGIRGNVFGNVFIYSGGHATVIGNQAASVTINGRKGPQAQRGGPSFR
jgi:curved DNA-binding protein CbpA